MEKIGVGNAGIIEVVVDGSLDMNGGKISTETSGLGVGGGNAGTIKVSVDGSFDMNGGIISSGASGIPGGNAGTSNAGTIKISVDGALDIHEGVISSTVISGVGNAGSIEVLVDGSMDIKDGIISSAALTLGGGSNAGTIEVSVDGSLDINGGVISTANIATVDTTRLALLEPATINISADNVALSDSFISTESSGNVPAGSITITVPNRLFLESSSVTTAANNADGGDITLSSDLAIFEDSQVTTSVTGQGDGGDIELNFTNHILDTGFIQANTAGSGAQGGNIAINVGALTASGSVLLTGSNTPFTFEAGSGNNVIQAAAPDGVSGTINNSSPELNIKGDLAGLTSDLTDVNTVVQDPCSIGGSQQSVLVTGRRGGLPETAQDALAVPLDRDRLQQILSDPDISGDDIAPHQLDVFLDSGNNRPTLATATLEHDCRKH